MELKSFTGFDNWHRPLPQQRAFYSPGLERYLDKESQLIANLTMRQLFINTFANTLDTTSYVIQRGGQPFTYIITGDIEAMWLRDSTAQVWHYFPMLNDSPEIVDLFRGLIRSHTTFITLDPYANAFYDTPKFGIHASDRTEMVPGVHERKWELDSLIFPISLAVKYWKTTSDRGPFDETWIASLGLILETLRTQQRRVDHGPYFFDRDTTNSIDTLSNRGIGPDYAYTGLIASSFRPSDDACELPFNVPGNLFARATLANLSQMLTSIGHSEFHDQISNLVQEISIGLNNWCLVRHPTYGEIYAYEVDGLGNYILMDDSNSPSLLSLPELDAISFDDPVYLATRKFALSECNPNFFKGTFACGMGSPHTGPDQIWPISLMMQASTSQDDLEIISCLKWLVGSSAGTGLLHESFHKDDPTKYSRPWFAWCNSIFGGLVARLLREKPELLDRI